VEKELSGYEEFAREQIKQARQANLAEYLIRQGVPLERVGQRYRHKEHNSLVFTENAYYWNSRGETGNAIDYLIRHLGMDFKTALYELTLTETQTNADIVIRKREIFDFTQFIIEPDMRRTIAYLNKSRGISYELIKQLIFDKLLLQEAETNNIIFPMYDETGSIVGAELCGTLTEKRFKGIKAGSEYGYGYTIQGKSEIKCALFFESAIDLLSFIDIERLKNKSIDSLALVSMAGLKDVILKQTLNRRNEPLQAVVCVDSDEAGVEFIKNVTGQISGIKILYPDVQYKDWNDQLQARKKLKTTPNRV
jgi:hypothetical protein